MTSIKRCEICERDIDPNSNWKLLYNLVHCEECLKEYDEEDINK